MALSLFVIHVCTYVIITWVYLVWFLFSLLISINELACIYCNSQLTCVFLFYLYLTLFLSAGYTVRKIEPAKNYDVESFARAMNPDFAPRLKKLFDPETEAAVRAQQTGKNTSCLSKPLLMKNNYFYVCLFDFRN